TDCVITRSRGLVSEDPRLGVNPIPRLKRDVSRLAFSNGGDINCDCLGFAVVSGTSEPHLLARGDPCQTACLRNCLYQREPWSQWKTTWLVDFAKQSNALA